MTYQRGTWVVLWALAAGSTLLASPMRAGHAQAPRPAPTAATPCDAAPAQGYSGAPTSLDFQGADVRAVLRTFADSNGLNMVIDPAVSGKVDIKLTDVPWDQALQVILKNSKLGCLLDGMVIRIVPLEVLKNEEVAKQALADAQAPAAIRSRTFPLSYADAVKIEPLIKAFLSKYGDAQKDDRTNTLIVRDLPEKLDEVDALLRTLDRPQPQVEIEARIVETDRDSAAELGVQWGVNGRATPALGNTTGLAFPNNGTLSGRIGDPTAAAPAAVNLPAAGATSAIGLSLGAINGAFNLDVALSALSHAGKLHVLSTPHVTTQNNVQAQVTQGTTVPYQTTSNNTTSVAFRDAALQLTVTPHVIGADTVIMDIEVENGTPDFGHNVNGNPTIITQKASTKVQVLDGVMTVIGGIVITKETTAVDKTPGVANIPLLGWLFRHHANSNENNELLIFITPRILRTAGAAGNGGTK